MGTQEGLEKAGGGSHRHVRKHTLGSWEEKSWKLLGVSSLLLPALLLATSSFLLFLFPTNWSWARHHMVKAQSFILTSHTSHELRVPRLFSLLTSWLQVLESPLLSQVWSLARMTHRTQENVGGSVVSESLWPHGLWPTRLLFPWDSPGKNTRVGSHSLLQGIFPTQGLNPDRLHYRQNLYCLSYQEVFYILV